MDVRVKKSGLMGSKRIMAEGIIDDIIIKEDFLNPEKEKVHIYFRGSDASGILSLSKYELDNLNRSLKSKLSLIKKSKKLRA